MATPNILSNTTVNADFQTLAVTASATAIVSNALASGKLSKVVHLNIAQIHASTSGTITVDTFDGTNVRRIINALPVGINSAITVCDANRPIFLLEGWSLRLTADAVSKFEAVANVEIWT